MDRLSNDRVYRVVVVYIHLLQSLHLQRVEVHIQRQQVEREIPDIHIVREHVVLKELLAGNGSLWPETRVVFLVAFVLVQLNNLLEHQQILPGRLQENHDLVVVVGNRQRFERQNTSLVRHTVFRKDLFFDDQIDRNTHLAVQHEQLLPRYLH